jgi:DNA-binding transcriptional ArsR family regulator
MAVDQKVRDFTTTEQGLLVEVASGEAFELLLSLFTLGGEDEPADFEIGPDWFAGIRERAGASLLAEATELGDWSVWVALLGEAHAMGAPHTVEHLLEHLKRIDPVALRGVMLEVGVCHATEPVAPNDVAALAAGEPGAAEAASSWCEKCPGLMHLLALPPAVSRDRIVDLLRRFADARPIPEGTAGILERDAEHKRSLARRLEPQRLIEQATNGITVTPRPGLEDVVLIPSVVVRPWVIICERGGTRILCYSVDEAILDGDPDAPPAWLVQFYKALGDERRLTILRRLAEGPASFGDLVDLLDLSKSTVHHHIRQLRTAGLVRVTVGDDKEYSLRSGTVPEAARLLEGFLGTTHEA